MPIDRDPVNLRRECESALALRRKSTRISQKMILAYAANEERESYGSPDAGYLNHAFEFQANFVPTLVSGLLRCEVTDAGVQDEETEALTTGFRALLPAIHIDRTLQEIAYDIAFDFGCARVDMEDTPGWKPNKNKSKASDAPTQGKNSDGKTEDESYGGDATGWRPQRPCVKRVSPRMYFEDARGPLHGKARFQGHIVVAQRDDMLKARDASGKPKYNREAVLELASQAGIREVQQDLMQDQIYLSTETEDQVVYFEIYLHEYKSWVCIGFTNDLAVSLRDEREAVVPTRCGGPYQKFGIYTTPDQVYPLSPLAVTRRQVEEINRQEAQMSRDAGAHKRFVIVDGAQAGVVAAITHANSSSVLSIPGFTGVVQQIEVGGAMDKQILFSQGLRGNLDRTSGLSNAARGDVKAGTTATGDSIAEQHTDIRTGYTKGRFKDSVSEVLGKMAELMDDCDDVNFPIVQVTTDPETGEETKQRGTFMGGHGADVADPQGAQSVWERTLTIEIEPFTMEYVNQTQRRQDLLQAQEYAVNVANLMAQNPAIKGKALVDDMFETLNIPEAGERYINFALMRQQIAARLQQEQAAAQGGQDKDPVKISMSLEGADMANPQVLSMLQYSGALPPGQAGVSPALQGGQPPTPPSAPPQPQLLSTPRSNPRKAKTGGKPGSPGMHKVAKPVSVS